MRLVLTAICVLCASTAAFAHGGSYRGGGGNPAGPSVPPGTADRPSPQTSWETWWSANKEFHLRLHDKMRDGDGAAVTPGSDDEARTARELRAEQDAVKRDELIPVFLESLTDKSFEVRTAAAIALGKMGDPRASGPLRTAAEKDPHNDVRNSAVLALGMLDREENIPYLLAMLMDRSQNTRQRSFAAFGLGLTGGDDAAALLVRFLRGGGPRITGGRRLTAPLEASCYVALGLTGSESVLATLRHAAGKHDDDNVRAFAVLSLGRLADTDSRDAVTRMLRREKKANMRRSAAITLGKIAGPGDTDAVDALMRALDDSDPVTRHFAAVALGGIADDALRARLRAAMLKSPRMDRPFYALALALARDTAAAPAVRAYLRSESDENLRGGYCIALGLMGDADAVPLLEKQARERGEIWLPGYAALALGMIGSRGSAPMLRERLENENDPRLRMNLAVALGLMHDPAARTFLIETVRSSKGSILERGSAAMAIGVLRLNSAADDLLAVVRDRKEQDIVRALAVVALGVLADPSPVPKLARFSIDNNYGVTVDPLNEVLSIL